MKPYLHISIALIAVALIGADPATAWKKVQEGIAAFGAGKFEDADSLFEAAEQSAEERSRQAGRIKFNQACVKAALADADKALELYRESANVRASGVSADAQYNMGCLDADKAKKTFGDDPLSADQETRKEGLTDLVSAIGHYRSALQIDPNHTDARHNLEVLRLWIKQMEAMWAKRDKEAARKEKNLLEFLKYIEAQQMELRSFTRVLNTEDDSPKRRQVVIEMVERQRELATETTPLKEKIVSTLQQNQPGQQPASLPNGPSGQQANPQVSEQQKQAIELLSNLADKAGEAMDQSANHLSSQALADAIDSQESALERLNEIYMVVAPFPELVSRAVDEQSQLVDESAPIEDEQQPTATDPEDTNEGLANETAYTADTDQPQSPDEYDYEQAAWQQRRVGSYASVLAPKAQSQIAAVDEQIQSIKQQLTNQESGDSTTEESKQEPDAAASPNGNLGNPGSPGDPNNPQTEDPVKQLKKAETQAKQLKKALQKAIEVGPQIGERTTSSVDSLRSQNSTAAHPDQTEALRLLNEIKDLLPKNDQDQQDNKDEQNQDDKKQQDQDQNENDQKKQDDKKQDQKQKNDQQKNDKSKQQDKQKQQKQASRQKVESMLQKVRERERKHREMKQKLLEVLVPGKVERDW